MFIVLHISSCLTFIYFCLALDLCFIWLLRSCNNPCYITLHLSFIWVCCLALHFSFIWVCCLALDLSFPWGLIVSLMDHSNLWTNHIKPLYLFYKCSCNFGPEDKMNILHVEMQKLILFTQRNIN